MSGGQERNIDIVHPIALTERQNVFAALPRYARLHEARGSLRDNDFVVPCDVVAVRVRDKGEPFCVPGIEPQIRLRQIKAALVANINHA